ncbi:MAG: glutamate--cysteine ligase, partial [Opitutae bacterium]|nr:glutamate--cysteine ligase [Opitutae bacterium]
MGQEVKGKSFTQADFDVFSKKVKEETSIILKHFDKRNFVTPDVPLCGLEMEAWLINDDSLPNPIAETFLKKIDNPLIVPEISQFNFEINTDPMLLQGKVFSNFHKNLKETFSNCRKVAKSLDSEAMFIGSLPTIRKYMLDLEYIYPNMRYYALNEQIISMRHKENMSVEIKGIEELEETFNSIMLECAATSFQLHLQIDPLRGKEFYNASLLASPFMASVSANSPFLFGKSLWSETRIAIFEQAVKLDSYKENRGKLANRVSFGSGYVKSCISEIYQENLNYSILLPECFEDDPQEMNHLNFHNGTIWRWNRPVIGLTSEGKPHLRIEHRVPSSGPSITDMVADM